MDMLFRKSEAQFSHMHFTAIKLLAGVANQWASFMLKVSAFDTSNIDAGKGWEINQLLTENV